MAGGELVLLYQLPDSRRQVQKPQGVGHGAAGLAHPAGGLLLGHMIGFNQGLEAGCFLHGVQILPLEVFNHGQLRGLAVVRLHDDDGNFLQACHPGGPPAALTGDDLIVAGGEPAHGQGLDNTVLLNGGGQLRQRRLVKVLTGLGGAALHLGDGQIQAAGGLGFQHIIAQQGAEAPTEAGGFFGCHGNAPFQGFR